MGQCVSACPAAQRLSIKHLTWFSRQLVTDTHMAVQWIYDRLDLFSLLLDGPARHRAELWLRSVNAQRSTYAGICAGAGFSFNAPDAEGVHYLLSVSPLRPPLSERSAA